MGIVVFLFFSFFLWNHKWFIFGNIFSAEVFSSKTLSGYKPSDSGCVSLRRSRSKGRLIELVCFCSFPTPQRGGKHTSLSTSLNTVLVCSCVFSLISRLTKDPWPTPYGMWQPTRVRTASHHSDFHLLTRSHTNFMNSHSLWCCFSGKEWLRAELAVSTFWPNEYQVTARTTTQPSAVLKRDFLLCLPTLLCSCECVNTTRAHAARQAADLFVLTEAQEVTIRLQRSWDKWGRGVCLCVYWHVFECRHDWILTWYSVCFNF